MRVPVIVLMLALASPAAAREAPPPHRAQRAENRHERGEGRVVRPDAGVVRPAPRVVHPAPATYTLHRRVFRPQVRRVEVYRAERYALPMEAYAFQRLLGTVQDQPFGEDRLLVISLAARDQLFSVDQVMALLDAMTFGSEKMDALRMLAPRIVDPENRFEIVSAFTFSSERREAAALLA